MPDDAATEKAQILEALGAEVQRVRPVSIVHPDHHVNVARRRAAAEQGAVFVDQFENPANLRAHLKTGVHMPGLTCVLPVQARASYVYKSHGLLARCLIR